MSERRPSYFQLCPAEPFRIFFPLAVLIGISGVSLWPLFFSGLHKFYPGMMHARMMIEGFLGGFVIGFLGTAMPRLLSAPALRSWEVWTLVLLHLLGTGLHIGHQHLTGDTVFIAELALFAVFLIRRIRRRVELPPPGFVLVAMGYLSGLLGTALWVAGSQGWVGGNWMLTGNLWLHQAFVLLLVLGVGTFLLPRFLALPGILPLDEERTASPAWFRRAAFAGILGLTILVSYGYEATTGAAENAAILRGVTVLVYLAAMVPIYRTPNPGRIVAVAVNLALLAVVFGMFFPLLWPSQRVAGLHVVFVGGFSLITFTVATRVVLGHSGQGERFRQPLPALSVVVAILVVGVALRTIGDFLPTRPSWLNGASYLWMLAAGIWGWHYLPAVRIADPEDTPNGVPSP